MTIDAEKEVKPRRVKAVVARGRTVQIDGVDYAPGQEVSIDPADRRWLTDHGFLVALADVEQAKALDVSQEAQRVIGG